MLKIARKRDFLPFLMTAFLIRSLLVINTFAHGLQGQLFSAFACELPAKLRFSGVLANGFPLKNVHDAHIS